MEGWTSEQSGSLTIGDSTLNYGGGDLWNINTAGLLLECTSKTEIAAHDGGTRLASCMYPFCWLSLRMYKSLILPMTGLIKIIIQSANR
jgi:hypothetical protein